MRTFLVLICSLALACAAGGAQDKNKSKKQAPKKNQTQSAQHAAASSSGPRKTKGSQRVTTVCAGAYYQGEVDGLLGPLTRAAVANYQRDHGLYITSAIDRPTLSSLGMT